MTDKEGTLRMQASGRWAICRLGREPVEITNGEAFRVAVPGTKGLSVTRMEYRPARGAGGYYSANGHFLHDGLRAAIGAKD
jgi:hypothetical protein